MPGVSIHATQVSKGVDSPPRHKPGKPARLPVIYSGPGNAAGLGADGLTRLWSYAVTVSPLVAIVTVLACFVLGLVALIRARPEDIPKFLRGFGRWFGK